MEFFNDERTLWALTPALIALVSYVLFRNHKWYNNDALIQTAFFFGVMGLSFGRKVFHFDSCISVFLVSSSVTISAMAFVTMNKVSKAKRKD